MNTNVIEIEWAWDHPVIQDIFLTHYREWLFNTPEMAKKMVERVLAISGISSPGNILDIGCGLGYHAGAFAEKGYTVLAFDPGDKYLDIARENLSENEGNVTLRKMATSDLDESSRFNLAWAGWYCPGQREPLELVQDFVRIYKALLPGGWFVSQVAGKPKVPPSEKTRSWRQLSDCFALTEKWADESLFHEKCWFVYPETNRVITFYEVERMYGVNEFLPLLAEAGFRDISTALTLKGDETAQDGKHFAFWCRKPAGA